MVIVPAIVVVSPSPEEKEKQSSQWLPTDYGTNAAEKRMPFDAADHEIDYGTD